MYTYYKKEIINTPKFNKGDIVMSIFTNEFGTIIDYIDKPSKDTPSLYIVKYNYDNEKYETEDSLISIEDLETIPICSKINNDYDDICVNDSKTDIVSIQPKTLTLIDNVIDNIDNIDNKINDVIINIDNKINNIEIKNKKTNKLMKLAVLSKFI